MQLFCFPYAGGTSTIYNDWTLLLDKSIELIKVDMSGRGSRAGLEKYESFQEVVADLYAFCKTKMDGGKYAFFGYSMGALIALEMTKMFGEFDGLIPEHIFLAASNTPEISKRQFDPEDKNIDKKIIQMGGIPQEIIQNKKFLNYYITAIKKDFRLMTECNIDSKKFSVQCNVSVLYGIGDRAIKKDNITDWNQYCARECKYYAFGGDHFFINENMDSIVNLVNRTLIG